MNNYEAVYEKLFAINLRRYSSIQRSIKRRVERVLINPYYNTETLGDASEKLNLLGCRSPVLIGISVLFLLSARNAEILRNVNTASVKICRIKQLYS